MGKEITIVVQGAEGISDVPGLDRIEDQADFRFATDEETLRAALSGADALLGWNFRADDLEQCWDVAGSLKWIHWGGAGVDAALFPALASSNVTLTNSGGIFDRSMAEWTLGMMIAHAKLLPETLMLQQKREWNYRLNTQMLDQTLTIVGVGSIGRAIARMASAFGLKVTGVGRTERTGDPDFGHILGRDKLDNALGAADYVCLITPLTEETRNLFDAARFKAMKPGAMFINIGRGPLVDESALIKALESGQVGYAALDVFCEEPLSKDNPIWDVPNIIISPHMSGDFHEHHAAIADRFMENFALYKDGKDLINVVDKARGFVPSISSS